MSKISELLGKDNKSKITKSEYTSFREFYKDSGQTFVEQNAVNHPLHYQGNKFEVIDIIEDYKLGFNLGNAIKYILRAGKKDDYKQDLNKAIWYLNREISKEN